MATRLLDITEGWRGLITVYVEEKVNGVWTAKDLTNYTVKFGLMRGATDTLLTGTVTKLNQTTNRGYYTYLPAGASDFAIADDAPYEKQYGHTILIDSNGRDVTAPNGPAMEILVHRRVPNA